jgi:hypothetical protein
MKQAGIKKLRRVGSGQHQRITRACHLHKTDDEPCPDKTCRSKNCGEPACANNAQRQRSAQALRSQLWLFIDKPVFLTLARSLRRDIEPGGRFFCAADNQTTTNHRKIR